MDFTTLELRYVGTPVKGKGLDYGFSAKNYPEEKSGWGGKEKAQLISDPERACPHRSVAGDR
ncbi:hypothetical protein ACFWDI_09295 [Streptomyces sp. NPDC060064]|uniref:hypothetical protein n=1 Tax=Streptomyces sp. NPDC060064 TaxID=3347049 RepID=UPI003699165C